MVEEQLGQLLEADPAASVAYRALTQAGGQVYIVGGAVRDVSAGRTPNDIDLMVTGLDADAIEQALQGQGKLDFTGKAFGVFRLRVGQGDVEIAMPRTETSTGSGHTDFNVQANPNLSVEDDLKRRDFTVNAMAYNPDTGELIDPYGGQGDQETGQLRLVNDNALAEDPLRTLRAVVAVAKQGLEPDDQLIHAMQQEASSIRHLPGERIQAELDKLLSAPDPSRALQILFDTGLVDYILPELSATIGFDQQNPHHDLTVDQHTLAVVKAMARLSDDPDMRLAALFHDSGKPDSFWQDPDAPEGGGGHFYQGELNGVPVGQNHQDVGADLVREMMTRLRYPKSRIDRVENLVAMHMFPYFSTKKGARQFLQKLNGDVKMANDLLLLRQADASGKSDGTISDYDARMLAQEHKLLQDTIDDSHALTVRDLAIDGNDLIALGVPKGPMIGQLLKQMLDVVIDDPKLNTKEGLTGWLENRMPKMSKVSQKPHPFQIEEIEQPKWKWSYPHKEPGDVEDGIYTFGELWIWQPDDISGRPHHIEVTGMDFYKYAQGRIYIDNGTFIEILVWSDRGNASLQDKAVEAVEEFLENKYGREADLVSWQSEGISWGGLGRDPTEDEIAQHYYDPDDTADIPYAGWAVQQPYTETDQDWEDHIMQRYEG